MPDTKRPLSEEVGTARERKIALVLEQVWFASLLGWATGHHSGRTVNQRIRETAELLLPDGDA